MRTISVVALGTLLLLSTPRSAAAAPAQLRLQLAPGTGSLLPQVRPGQAAGRLWGAGGAASLAIGISDLLWLQLHADRTTFLSDPPGPDATIAAAQVWGATLVYNIDLLRVTPFVELGVGSVTLLDDRRPAEAQLVPILGVGFDVSVTDIILLGAVVRYHALFDSELLANPAYATAQGRIGVTLDVFELLR